MNVNQIKALHLLARTGSVSSTARLMNLSQSAISKMIRALEEEIGIPLLDHARGKVRPRSELAMLLPSIERITQEISDLRALTEDLRSGAAAPLTISCSTTVAMSLVLPALRSLAVSHPDLRATVIARGGRFSFDDVASNRANLGIEQPIVTKSNVESRRLARSRMICVLPPGHALRGRAEINAQELGGRQVILYPAKTINGGRVQALLRELGVNYQPVFQTDSGLLACRMAMDLGVLAIIDSMMDVAGLFPELQRAEFLPAVNFELQAFWKAQSMRGPLGTLIERLVAVGQSFG